MEFKYTFIGVVLPERAQMSYSFSLKINLISGSEGVFECSIVNNQLLAIVRLEENVDIMTLRNITHNIIQNYLSLLGFYSGVYYDIKVDRVYNDDLSVDYVYGVANTDIQEFWGAVDLFVTLNEGLPKTYGQAGVLLSRALNDLMSALRNADDAAFYCYRAIESLKNHNSLLKNITIKEERYHWKSFRETSDCSRAEIDEVKIFSDDLRHGKPVAMTADEVKHVLVKTWGITRKYFNKI
ncbi:hypothetical protein [Serratia sp. NFX21]|uniref:hypothetical protein n=1 Tax=Serratia sp. NFX21 TaxID=3402279 RepID=UPI003AF3381B